MTKGVQFFPSGKFQRLNVIGAGRAAMDVAKWAADNSVHMELITSPRQQDLHLWSGELLLDALGQFDVVRHVVPNLKAGKNSPYETVDDKTLILSLGSLFILSEELVALYQGRVINSHGANLPEDRGGGGYSWRILSGDKRGSTCFHLVASGIDAGNIVFKRSYTFPSELRFPRDYMAHGEAETGRDLVRFLDQVRAGETFDLTEQDESQATYFPRLDTPLHAYIDWSWTGMEIERYVLAFSYPYEGAKTFFGDALVHIRDATFLAGEGRHPFMDGLVLRHDQGDYFVACADGMVQIPESEVSLEGKGITCGDRLHTPRQHLDDARTTRIKFTPMGSKVQGQSDD